jgi:hypothetical protein
MILDFVSSEKILTCERTILCNNSYYQGILLIGSLDPEIRSGEVEHRQI